MGPFLKFLSIFHECTKRIKVDWHFIWEQLQDNLLTLPHVFSSN